ncbi:MAG TPA: tRNA pseudouridine(38-40) synthase TruA [Anaerolineales bacterium]|nr:tRNA pseudouridine(38-40) synthase TruA [Anaerolineales bacterium]
MARYQIILAYDGTGFLGSQRQAESRTVQSELEKALRKIGWRGRSVLLAGRTDTGTHASGQVAAFDLDWVHGLDRLQAALNSNLPADMAVRQIALAADDFHPRFDASSRCYRYRLFCSDVRDPLRERFAWRVWPGVTDLVSLAEIWTGTHDFAAFGTPPRSGGSTVRTVQSAGWHKRGDEWTFEIRADAFLYRMVRRLVYVQAAVGQGRLPAETLVRALDDRFEIRRIARMEIPAGLAPASGLTLVEVCYENLA